MIEQFSTEQFVIVIVIVTGFKQTLPINPPEKEQEGFEEVIEQFWIEQFVIVIAKLELPINPPE